MQLHRPCYLLPAQCQLSRTVETSRAFRGTSVLPSSSLAASFILFIYIYINYCFSFDFMHVLGIPKLKSPG